MADKADSLINLVSGAAVAIQLEMEEAIPGPWSDTLRVAVRTALEEGIGPPVVKVLEWLVKSRPPEP